MAYVEYITPKHYEISLNLDLEKNTFKGETIVSLESSQFTSEVILNIDQIIIENCHILHNNAKLLCEYESKQEKKEVRIILPEQMKGDIKFIIQYSGKYQSDLLGMYKSKYEYQGKEKYLISTQLEEIYARRVFPCIDHPSKKATFKIEMTIDQELTAISNTSVEKEIKLEGGKKIIAFRETPKMCTYLLYIGVGGFELKEKREKHSVRVITTPGKTQYGELSMDTALQSLVFCESYTGQKYPLEKCDLIAVPDFPFGAMENWGAITFRENMLLVYPDKTSKIGIFNIASVVAHEVSHFWFGNLVSPLEWKYIWLNESFASYFTYAIPQEYHPEWHSWEHFIVQYYDSSLERDGLINTFPVELEGDEEIFITPAKVGIVYSKGATILRMMVNFLGDENFKKGVGNFMHKFEYSNATSQDYWNALEEGSGEPIKEFADSWVHQSGYPIINLKRKNNKLILEQEHFTYLPKDSESRRKLWFIPISMQLFTEDGEAKTLDFILKEERKTIEIQNTIKAVKMNLGHTGFYRVNYERSLLNSLGGLIKTHTLSPIDRYGIENDLFALVKKGVEDIDFYLEYVNTHYIEENEYLPLVSIFSHLFYIFLLKGDSKTSKIKSIGKRIISRFFEKHGLEVQEDEEMRISILKNYLLYAGSRMEMKEVLNFCLAKFENLLNEKNISPDILSSVLKVGAMNHSGAKKYFLKKIESPETPQVEKAYVYEAFGCFQEREQILEVLNNILQKIPPQSWLYTFRRLGSNKHAFDVLWLWFKEKLEELEKLSPFVLARTIAALVPFGGLYEKEEVDSFLKEYADENNFHRDTIEMTLELLEINYRFSTR